MKKEYIIIYTDGACSGNQNIENVGGYGAFLKYNDYTKEICGGEKNTTNNRMELKGVIEALKLLKRRDIPVKLHTDSAYISNCINGKWYESWIKNGWKNSKKKPVENKDLWEELINLYKNIEEIEIIKVKGHSGVELNEKADELANKGMEQIRCLDI